MPRLSTYTIEQLRQKAVDARNFAERCEAAAAKKEAAAIAQAIMKQSEQLGIEPSRVLDRLSQVQRVEPLPNE